MPCVGYTNAVWGANSLHPCGPYDLRLVGDLAMELGCSMAQRHDAQPYVLHAAEHPELDAMRPARASAEDTAKYRQDTEQHIAEQ